jgi:hypothetical protein
VIDIFDKRVIPEPNSGCWLWTGAENQGYGRVYKWRGRSQMAHRVAYEHAHGPIPAGLHLDHLCRNTYCVNPDHLEPVTCAENIKRGNTGINNRSKDRCPQGHPYDAENTGVTFSKGAWVRFCISCRIQRRGSQESEVTQRALRGDRT